MGYRDYENRLKKKRKVVACRVRCKLYSLCVRYIVCSALRVGRWAFASCSLLSVLLSWLVICPICPSSLDARVMMYCVSLTFRLCFAVCVGTQENKRRKTFALYSPAFISLLCCAFISL